MQDVLKFEAVVELLMGDEESAKELLKSYLAQTEEHFTILSSLLNEGAFETKREEIRHEAHLLKGSSLNVSANDFANVMLEMEKGSKVLNQQELLKLYLIANEKLSILKQEIKKIIG